MYEAVYHCEQVLLLMHAHDVVLVRANQSLCSPPQCEFSLDLYGER